MPEALLLHSACYGRSGGPGVLPMVQATIITTTTTVTSMSVLLLPLLQEWGFVDKDGSCVLHTSTCTCDIHMPMLPVGY